MEREIASGSAGLSESPAGRAPVWSELVGRIVADDPKGMEDLYHLFVRGIRFYICRQLGPQELEDRVHDTFLAVLQAIRKGEVRDPDRLIGFVRTIVRRQVACYIAANMQDRRERTELEPAISVTDSRHDPEQDAIVRQQGEIVRKILEGISVRDREILSRFYLLGQSQQQICDDMGLSGTQFRLLKSRAKARFGDLGKKHLARRSLAALILRENPPPGH